MSFLTSAELTDMKNVVLEAMPDICVISAAYYVSDGAGGGTATYAPVTGGTVVCRVDPGAAKRTKGAVMAESEGLIYPFVFTLPITAPIAINRQITHQGHTYQIQGMSDDPSWVLCRRAYCERLSNVGS